MAAAEQAAPQTMDDPLTLARARVRAKRGDLGAA
jgi:hypothetical protein